jgi:plastocyanin
VTYTFTISSPGHPFWIKTMQVPGTASGYTNGVSASGVTSGTIEFTVPADAPSTLYYICEYHPNMSGAINVLGGLVPGPRSD